MEHTELSKTALANNLKQLMEKRLIQRVARGEYRLTVDGKDLIDAAATVYRDSARRADERRERLRRRYTTSMIEGKTLSKKTISAKVEYQPCWLSYTGAIAGALKALGVDCDIADVGGRSGYAFMVNVAKGVTCPSGPTALPLETWREIHKGTETLGWTMEHYDYPHSYPAEEGNPTPEEIEVAMELIDIVLKEPHQKDYAINCMANDEDRAVGYICYGPVPMTQGTFDLYWIVVDPQFQRQGVGSRLLRFLEGVVKERKGRMILIDTSSTPEYESTHKFYLRHGFQEVARVPDYYHLGNDRITFCKRLEARG